MERVRDPAQLSERRDRRGPWAHANQGFQRRRRCRSRVGSICPARARLVNVPFRTSGHHYGDIILHDGAPNGERVYGETTYPVFDEIELWSQSGIPMVVASIAGFRGEDDRRAFSDSLRSIRDPTRGLVERPYALPPVLRRNAWSWPLTRTCISRRNLRLCRFARRSDFGSRRVGERPLHLHLHD